MTAETFRHLLEPITLGSTQISNRVCLTGHGTGMPTDGTPNDQLIAYYEERAKGEVGLIMLGSQQVHSSSPGITGLLCNYDDRIIPNLSKLARAVQPHGSKVFGYLSHMGFASSARPVALWSASADFEEKYGEVAHAMTLEEIEIIVAAHAASAARCIEAGLDGIEVHCGHGLLVQQFLSPLTNHREDDYGGTLWNRSRFARQILAAVRKRIGPDIPLGIRCSGDELVPGGLSGEDMAEVVPWLVEAGALDFVDVSAGTDGNLVSNMLHEPPMGLPPGPFRPLSRRIKEKVDVPIIHGTRIHTAEFAEDMIARGDADMAGMARALIADPALPRKARLRQAGRITPCIACEQACFGRLYRGRHISCIGNPVTGREQSYAPLPEANDTHRVVVIGGGPAGMEAARVAALRGHKVSLLEAAPELGGRLNVAKLPEGRQEWQRLIDHKASELVRLGVDLHLSTRADMTKVTELCPDHIVIASGAQPRLFMLKGAKEGEIQSLDEAVLDWAQRGQRLGRRVLVIDQLNRAPGIAAALSFARAGHEVTVCSTGFHIGQSLEIQNISYFYREAIGAGVRFLPTVKPVEKEGKTVLFENIFTRTVLERAPFDTLVMAAPGQPDTHLTQDLSALDVPLHVIGDAYAPRDSEAALLDGFELGARL